MLRPSAIMAAIAGRPSLVAGIFTSRFGWLMRPCRSRADAIVPSVSWARAGETSIDTKPSPPSLSSYTPLSTPRAPSTSAITRSQYASSTVAPLLRAVENSSS